MGRDLRLDDLVGQPAVPALRPVGQESAADQVERGAVPPYDFSALRTLDTYVIGHAAEPAPGQSRERLKIWAFSAASARLNAVSRWRVTADCLAWVSTIDAVARPTPSITVMSTSPAKTLPKLPVGTVIVNPRTDRVRKIVVETGADHLKQWMHYERQIKDDFEKAFGEPAGTLLGLAIMTDTDNTQGKARAWYGEIRLD